MAESFIIAEELDGLRADVAAARATGLTRSHAGQLLATGAARIDGKTTAKSAKVKSGSVLQVDDLAPRAATVAAELVPGIHIVYDDADIVVVDKPPGVAAHPSAAWDGPSVVGHLAAAGFAIHTSGLPERRGIVQRLDVGTSGLMVVAKTEEAYTALRQAFHDRTVEKEYHALAQGHPDPAAGVIDAPIGRHRSQDYKMAVVAGGREAVTHYGTLAAFRNTALLAIHLETGRTHQIRVHLQAIGHPCCGDPIYGADPVLAAQLGLTRQWLHAVRLAFEHPVEHKWVEFASGYPADLQRALDIVR